MIQSYGAWFEVTVGDGSHPGLRYETIRIAQSISDLEQLLRNLKMPLPRPDLVQTLETLVDEEFLFRDDGRYTFSVPLFRRWISEKQKPEIVRELTL